MEVIIGAPQRGPYHLALRQANPGTFFAGILITFVLNLKISLKPWATTVWSTCRHLQYSIAVC